MICVSHYTARSRLNLTAANQSVKMTLDSLWIETKENNYEKNKIHLLLVVSSISGLPYIEVTNIARKDRKAKNFRSSTILHRQNYANLSQLENSCLSWESPAVTQTSSVAFYCLYCFHPRLIKQSLRAICIGRNVTEDKSSFDILIDFIDIHTDGSYRSWHSWFINTTIGVISWRNQRQLNKRSPDW